MRSSIVRLSFLVICFAGSQLVPAGQPVMAESQQLTIDLYFPSPSEEKNALEVELSFDGAKKGEETGELIVEVAKEWGGSTFEEGIIEKVRIVGEPVGQPEAKEGESSGEKRVEMAEAPHAWRVRRPAGSEEPLRLRYAVPANEFIRGTDGDSYYKPIVMADLVHLIGHQALLLPRSWDDESTLDVTLRWKGLPEGASAVSSFGVGPGPHRFETTKGALRSGLFVAGQGDLVAGEGEDPVHVFLARGPWRFEAAEFAEIAQEIVPAEREFFREKNAGPFLITAIPIGPEEPEYINYGGTGLEKAFATFIVPVLALEGDGREGLNYLLAHEKAHTWIGGLVATGEEPETAGYWFSEGVTDYYTPRLLHRAGILTPEQVIDEWNGYLQRYFLSPTPRASNEQIRDGFWSDRDLQQLAYMRGAAVILYLDHARLRRTGGEARFDQLLFAELDKAREAGHQRKLSNDELRKLLGAGWTEEEIETAFAALIDGEVLELPPDLLAPCAELAWHEETPFQLGFTFDESTGEILSVEKGTNAYLVGLRAGQQLSGWSIRYGRPSIEVVLKRKVGDAEQQVRFMPAGPKRQVPRFEVADAAACAALM